MARRGVSTRNAGFHRDARRITLGTFLEVMRQTLHDQFQRCLGAVVGEGERLNSGSFVDLDRL